MNVLTKLLIAALLSLFGTLNEEPMESDKEATHREDCEKTAIISDKNMETSYYLKE